MQKITIATIIIILLLAVGVIFFGWPEYKQFNDLSFQVKTSRVDLTNKQAYFSKLNDISSKIKEHNVELSKIESALPATSVTPDLINFLAEKSSQNGLILEKVDLQKTSLVSQDSQVQKAVLNLTLTGFYPALRNFISNIQNNAKIIEIDSINFSQPQKGGIFTFNLSIETYSY